MSEELAPAFPLRRVRASDLEPERELPYFLRAIETDAHCGGLDGVLAMLGAGHFQLWVWEREDSFAVLITQIVTQVDHSKEMLLRMFAGENVIQRYPEMTSYFEDFAEHEGCARMTAYVKPELLEMFRKAGEQRDTEFDFEATYLVISRDVGRDD